jgi:hypothetical protein
VQIALFTRSHERDVGAAELLQSFCKGLFVLFHRINLSHLSYSTPGGEPRSDGFSTRFELEIGYTVFPDHFKYCHKRNRERIGFDRHIHDMIG